MRVIGYYNEQGYSVVGIDLPKENYIQLYNAGNSPLDSQDYVPIERGVGLERMKQYCGQTTRDIAKEHKALYGGIEYEEPES